MPSPGPWTRTNAVGNRSSPAFLIATVVVAAGGLMVATQTGIGHPQQYLPLIGLAGVTLAALVLLRKAFGWGWAWATAPIHRRTALPPPVQTLSDAPGLVAEVCAGPSPDIRRLVDTLLHQAVGAGASDIHLVPYEGFVAVRFRIDGLLQDVAELPEAVRRTVSNRLKVLSRLVSFVQDRPQDGRFEFHAAGRPLDVRIAFMPTLHGERIVLRLARASESNLALEALGFTPSQLQTFTRLVSRPQGMVVLTGPAGSGKTTTIYAALASILEQTACTRSIYTLEDPVERDLLRINQTQIEEARGFTFAQGLRSLLRQDPDVIMVGEIRDLETARIALQAGMTGHMIITTVHTGSAAGVFTRLVEMGCDPRSVASAVTAVVSQRLVRLLCPHCKRVEAETQGATLFAPVGCGRCEMKGFRGRRALFEVFEMDEGLGRLVLGRASSPDLRREAARQGAKSLHQVGLGLASSGETSLAEVRQVAPAELGSD